MYTKRITIENVGPIQNVDIELPFQEGVPIPLILVGQNGSGKTLVLSFIANWLAIVQQQYCDNPDVISNATLKYRSPQYISSGKEYYWCHMEFTNNFSCDEWQLNCSHGKYDELKKYHSVHPSWDHPSWSIGGRDLSSNLIITPDVVSGGVNHLEHAMDDGAYLYFPANRFDEPAWFNVDNLHYTPRTEGFNRVNRQTDRHIVVSQPLRNVMDWLYGLVYDAKVLDSSHESTTIETSEGPVQITREESKNTASEHIFQLATEVMSMVLGKKSISSVLIRMGGRHARSIGFSVDHLDGNEVIVPNFFSLASGESSLLSMFLSIIRDHDLSKANPMSDIEGIVLIDEIDLHLHVEVQYDVVPKFIKMFPKIQFIITTHSPLFLLGMEKEFGSDGYAIIDMPSGQPIGCEAYREFGHAYDTFKSTRRFHDEIQTILHDRHKPVIFVEGETDVKYLSTAMQMLNRDKLTSAVDVRWIGSRDQNGHVTHTGKSALDKLVALLAIQPELVASKVIALYDTEVGKVETNTGNVFIMKMPFDSSNTKFKKGVENLLPAELAQDRFFSDKTKQNDDGGATVITSLNKVEFCNYICNERRDVSDFAGFAVLLDRIEQLLLQ